MEDPFGAIHVPLQDLKRDRFLRLQDLMGQHRMKRRLWFEIKNSLTVPNEVVERTWQIVPEIFTHKSLMDAASYYSESILLAWIGDDDVFEFMTDGSDVPHSTSDTARVETAYQNAFKAIEAIIGEPPRDTRRLRAKLKDAGINPDEVVGFDLYGMQPGKQAVIDKIIAMQQTRDQQAAHGGTHVPKTIGYCELKDKQALARHIILVHRESLAQHDKE